MMGYIGESFDGLWVLRVEGLKGGSGWFGFGFGWWVRLLRVLAVAVSGRRLGLDFGGLE